MDDLTIIARLKALDDEGDSVEIEIELEEGPDRLLMTLDSDRTLSFSAKAFMRALNVLKTCPAKALNTPEEE